MPKQRALPMFDPDPLEVLWSQFPDRRRHEVRFLYAQLIERAIRSSRTSRKREPTDENMQ